MGEVVGGRCELRCLQGTNQQVKAGVGELKYLSVVGEGLRMAGGMQRERGGVGRRWVGVVRMGKLPVVGLVKERCRLEDRKRKAG